MGHEYGIKPRFLSITPTRDNITAPSNRLSDKHSRLFCGKTLDEWTMIQLWSSKYLGKAIFVCENEQHRDRLLPLANKYGIELYVRPEQMLSPIDDTGGVPTVWALKRATQEGWWSLHTQPFVVSPCRPPGFFDNMVEQYLSMFGNPDTERGHMVAVGLYEFDGAMFELTQDRRMSQLGTIYLNKNAFARCGTCQHWMAWTHWYLNILPIQISRHDMEVKGKVFDIEWWQDIHIDTLDQWEQAEYWFTKKILSLGEDCYIKYRSNWEEKGCLI